MEVRIFGEEIFLPSAMEKCQESSDDEQEEIEVNKNVLFRVSEKVVQLQQQQQQM